MRKGSRIGGVILAAGISSRFGRVKQLVPLFGKPLLQHVVHIVHPDAHELARAPDRGSAPNLLQVDGRSLRARQRPTEEVIDATRQRHDLIPSRSIARPSTSVPGCTRCSSR